MERTFAFIKPDAVLRNLQGEIIDMMQKGGFKIVNMKMLQLNQEQASQFYALHKHQLFYNDLIDYMCSAPVVAIVLEAENAVTRYRDLMGATNPEDAQQGTIRKKYALNLRENSVHGSDSRNTAKQEIGYFFNNVDII